MAKSPTRCASGTGIQKASPLLTCKGSDAENPILFDLGRYGAGPLRLKYAHDQLRKIKKMKRPTEIAGDPSKTAYWRGRKEKGIRLWRRWLAKQGIFFSYPLDLDMMMVRAFPEAYCVDEVEAPEDTSALEASVFGEGPGLAAYQEKAPEDDLPTTKELVAYDKFFKKRGKPGSHLRALAKLTDETIQSDCPEPLRALIKRANKILRARSEQDAAEG